MFDLTSFAGLQQPGGLLMDLTSKKPDDSISSTILDLLMGEAGEGSASSMGYGQAPDMSNHATIGKLLALSNGMNRSQRQRQNINMNYHPYIRQLLGG